MAQLCFIYPKSYISYASIMLSFNKLAILKIFNLILKKDLRNNQVEKLLFFRFISHVKFYF